MTEPRRAYESCVIDSAGNCTRWSHDHSPLPTTTDYNRSIDRWARWFMFHDRLPRPLRRLVPRRYL